MSVLTSSEIRRQYLDFFEARGHTLVPYASLVPREDPTALFTNAGMMQFKDVFLGVGTRPYTRAVDSQKCLRVSGKHNDLEEVGPSPYHHTLFEMLGNWSFGDYYKGEAIHWAWELLTDVWGLPKDRLYVTCFEDDRGSVPRDDEAVGFWRSETDIDPSHILFFGRKDNFWAPGDTGPCGPNSEIHLDCGPEACDMSEVPGHRCKVNGDCRRYIELWNLVFIQYDLQADGSLNELPAKHVDTGMGFERIVAVLQNVQTNYDTDLFIPILDRVQEMLGHTDAQREAHTVPYRVLGDHARALAFLVGDGVLPGNEGPNYVLRLILRRAARYGKLLGFDGPFLAPLAELVIGIMGDYFVELRQRRAFILDTITQEERRFQVTLDVGLSLLEGLMADLQSAGQDLLPGRQAFKLYDTYGFPLDLTRDIAREQGFSVDEVGFQEAMAEQRARARAAQKFQMTEQEELERLSAILAELQAQGLVPEGGVAKEYEDHTRLSTEIVALVRDGRLLEYAEEGEEVEIVLPATPFYVESGGQVSDTGWLRCADDACPWEVEVADMRQPVPGLVLHGGRVIEGRLEPGLRTRAEVDVGRQHDIARNHSATHLLHHALRAVLGQHVQQSGSLVAPDRLRFDFTHPQSLTADELRQVEALVNDSILADHPVRAAQSGYREAVESGVIALFDEKYGDVVRVVKIGDDEHAFSRELCGGVHCHGTGEIGLFLVASESSVGAGLRRIEAVTGRAAAKLARQYRDRLHEAAERLACGPEEVPSRVDGLQRELHEQERELEEARRQQAQKEFEPLLRGKIEDVQGVHVLAQEVEAPDRETLREMTDWFREEFTSASAAVLGASIEGRPALVAVVTDDLVSRGLRADWLVREASQVMGGGGGGRATLAEGGGGDPRRLRDAIGRVPALVAAKIT
jgi:alanyl-tRNA synthetase